MQWSRQNDSFIHCLAADPQLQGLESPEMACERVANRVAEGGHNIPTDTIYRRYYLGLENLFNIFMPIVDFWALYDNNLTTQLIADNYDIVNKNLYTQIRQAICQNKKK